MKTIFVRDLPKRKMNVVREFAAPLKHVWKAWTDSELLDQWWAPEPWKAVTKTMDFREGGHWLYYMKGPDGTQSYARADYKTINPLKSFEGLDAFCDASGTINTEFPRMHWNVRFMETPSGTKVDIDITFASEADLMKIAELGFEEGFTMAHGNLDKLLSKQLVA